MLSFLFNLIIVLTLNFIPTQIPSAERQTSLKPDIKLNGDSLLVPLFATQKPTLFVEITFGRLSPRYLAGTPDKHTARSHRG